MDRAIILIIHNVRSCHNVGSLLRTAEGLGVRKVYLTGYTPYPLSTPDERLPHIAAKAHRQIQKTALGAEQTLEWNHRHDITAVIQELKQAAYVIAGLEQAPNSVPLAQLQVPERMALIVGRETDGIEAGVLEICNTVVEIPMFGQKESFNVVQAAAMALYHCRFAK